MEIRVVIAVAGLVTLLSAAGWRLLGILRSRR
jgi:hypothetical protein